VIRAIDGIDLQGQQLDGRIYCTGVGSPSDKQAKIELDGDGRSALAGICQTKIKRWLCTPDIAKQLGLSASAKLDPFADALQKVLPVATMITGDLKLDLSVRDPEGNLVNEIKDFLVVAYHQLSAMNAHAGGELNSLTSCLLQRHAELDDEFRQFCEKTSRQFDKVESRVDAQGRQIGRLGVEQAAAVEHLSDGMRSIKAFVRSSLQKHSTFVLVGFTLLVLIVMILMIGRGVQAHSNLREATAKRRHADWQESQFPTSAPEQGSTFKSRRCSTYGEVLNAKCIGVAIKDHRDTPFAGNLTLVHNCTESLDDFLKHALVPITPKTLFGLRERYLAQCKRTTDPDVGHYFGEYGCVAQNVGNSRMLTR
jgi:hypothetical protein